MKRIIYFILFVFLLPLISSATHNNAGEIIYRHIDNTPPYTPTYEITIITYTDPGSPADRDSLELRILLCGDLSQIATFFIPRTSKTAVNSVIQRNEYVLDSYTFPGLGCYQISMLDPNRIANIVNISGSVNVPFYLEDTIIIKDPQRFGFNSSPILSNPPIAYAKVGVPFFYNPGAFDPNGDSLTYELIPPKQNPVTNVPGYRFPDSNQTSLPKIFQIDRFTGELTWYTPYQAAIYNVAILIREYRQGEFIGSMIRDMQIRVTDDANRPPVLSEVRDTCIIAGSKLFLELTGTDPDANQTLTISSSGGPFHVPNNLATFDSFPSKSPTKAIFNWQTDCTHIRPGFYSVVFTLTDDYVHTGNIFQPHIDVETWIIKVIAPPPQNLTATTNFNDVVLNWDDPYQCASAPNFRGFSIWRKTGCDSLQVDSCQAGGLDAMGYTKISGNNPITSYNFTDQNITRGIYYSYRVQAEFAEAAFPGSIFTYNSVSSMPSDEACITLKKDVPLITNVDVVLTDPSIGVIDVKWLKPFVAEFDTLSNPGPYKFELYRYDNISAQGAAITVATFTSNSFKNLTDTTFTDSGLNTESSPYSYRVGFFATNSNTGQFYKVGDSDSASSVFLSVGTGSTILDLSWQENVPWENYEYVVFKETPTGSNNFIVLDTVSTNTYRDVSLTNGEKYCYKIQSIGSYFNPDIVEPLINHSQVSCGVPLDTIPPCPPKLNVSNDCIENTLITSMEDLENRLTWSADVNCPTDISQFKIYYTPSPTGDLKLLETIESGSITSYVHKVTSLAGCYSISAIDSVGNESLLSERICVNNCPQYQLPNAFTPNGDGFNDYFKPISPYLFVDKIDIKIFNKWGNLVFETTDPAIMWNGKDQSSGKVLSEGVYYYVCDVYYNLLEGVTKGEQLKGFIHLIQGNGNSN